jgi:uncharacterized protein (DUF488 family)
MIHSIGHSNHPQERFLGLLQQHQIDTLLDVRSVPWSRFNPQFNRARLADSLAAAGIGYVFLGDELGARSRDPSCYDDCGRVSYAALAGTAAFKAGLQRVQEAGTGRQPALMCAEREPLDCHRTILVARELERLNIPVRHILGDGQTVNHAELMRSLVHRLDLAADDLFDGPAQQREQAYNLQAARIAYVRKKPA